VTASSAQPPRLALKGITKRYPSVVANDGVDLTVAPGEIHAVLGENGAGKSTLMKIVYGVTRPDAGTIEWEGRPVDIRTPAEARRLGIGMVFQHFSLFETLTVAENIALALGEESESEFHTENTENTEQKQNNFLLRVLRALRVKSGSGFSARHTALAQRIRDVSQTYGLPIDPDRLVHAMSVGERQRVEIVRCLLQNPRLLIMDEPTSVLTPQAVQKLFETLRRLASEGVSILYISHKLDEIRALCDAATVLRAGKVSGTALPKQETSATLARLMVGADLKECQLTPRTPGNVELELHQLTLPTLDPFGTSLAKIDLEVRAGEIVGIAGVSGNGQKELLAVIAGETPTVGGAIRISGKQAGRRSAARRREMGLRYVPEERLGRGAVPEMNLAENSVLTGYGAGLVRGGLVQNGIARAFARETIECFKVKCASELAAANSLSGGNLQKFIVGRETRLGPRVMVVAQPTWGVDVGASLLIHQALIDLRDRGVAVLVISEELDELFSICDRLAVLAGGRLSKAEPTASMTLEKVGLWMAGDFDANPVATREASHGLA
jgi:ABC-type uncharacterized transport system ATPase subunit